MQNKRKLKKTKHGHYKGIIYNKKINKYNSVITHNNKKFYSNYVDDIK